MLFVNAVMLLVEGLAGIRAHSTALMADALDMPGDSLVFAFRRMVLTCSAQWQAISALTKGLFLLAFGLGVLAEGTFNIFHPIMQGIETMGLAGGIALAANIACFSLLYRYRGGDLNMHSTWLCSNNDLIANVGVLIVAGDKYLLVSRRPDIFVGGVIAGLFPRSAISGAAVLQLRLL